MTLFQVKHSIIVKHLLFYAALKPITTQYSRTDPLGDIYAGIP